MKETNKEEAPHPGKILKEEYVEPRGMSGRALGKAIGISGSAVNNLLYERHGITAFTALKFAKLFNTTAEYWMNLQVTYDLAKARREEDK